MCIVGAVSYFRLSLRKCKICTGKETVIPARGSQAQLVAGGGRQAARSGGTRRWGTSKARFSAIPERGACDLFVFVFLGPLGITGAQEVFIEQIKTENTLTRETEFTRTWGSDQRNKTTPEATTRAISTFSWQPGSAAAIRLAQGQVCSKYIWPDLSW